MLNVDRPFAARPGFRRTWPPKTCAVPSGIATLKKDLRVAPASPSCHLLARDVRHVSFVPRIWQRKRHVEPSAGRPAGGAPGGAPRGRGAGPLAGGAPAPAGAPRRPQLPRPLGAGAPGPSAWSTAWRRRRSPQGLAAPKKCNGWRLQLCRPPEAISWHLGGQQNCSRKKKTALGMLSGPSGAHVAKQLRRRGRGPPGGAGRPARGAAAPAGARAALATRGRPAS